MGGAITPGPNGLKLMPGSNAGDKAIIRQYHAFTPASGKLILVAARVYFEAAHNSRFFFGAWNGALDPEAQPPTAVAIQKYTDGVNAQGWLRRPLFGEQFVDLTTGLGTAGLTFVDGTFLDLAIVLLELSRVDFIWSRSDGTWGSIPLADSVTGAGQPIQAAFFYKRTAAQSQMGPVAIRSLHVQEVDLRE